MKSLAIEKYPRGCWIGGVAAWVALFGGQAEAATQGALGATTRGSIAISVSLAPSVQVSSVSDVTPGDVQPASTATVAQSVCVWSNTPAKGYSIAASGSGPANSFILANGSMAAPYSVAWSNSPGQTSGASLNPGTALTGLTSTATAPGCASGPATTASLIVTIGPTDRQPRLIEANYSGALGLQAMPTENSYSGALTLIVSPR